MIRNLKNIFHLFEAVFGHIIFGFPARKLKVIGITGTDGKTTTSSLIYHILKQSGKKVSLISTVSAKIGDTEYDTGFHVSTPGRHLIPKYLNESYKNGDEYFILETTSHALDQNRVFGITFEIALITNITHEHLDYHKTYENYLRAKAKLLLNSKQGLLNADDDSYKYLKEILESHSKLFKTYALHSAANYHLDIAKRIDKPLALFNSYNYLAAYAICRELGIAEDEIFEAMKTFILPSGRMEVVYTNDFEVIIDFAHTPNAFTQALSAIKKQMKTGRLIHVFGAASQRDDSKRPFMGEESAKYADMIILTEEDYRNENPRLIADMIATGIIKHGFKEVEAAESLEEKTYCFIPERQKAINKAIHEAKKGDVIVLTGKAHEKSLARNGTEHPWDEKEAVEKALQLKK